MNLRISATYAATGGSMAESVMVEFGEIDQEGTFDVDLAPILDRLLTAPSVRSMAMVSSPLPAPGLGYPLAHVAKQGDVLGLCSDGVVRNVGDTLAAHAKFALAGTAGEDLRSGDRVFWVDGKWRIGSQTTEEMA
jgi:hypothetical protein